MPSHAYMVIDLGEYHVDDLNDAYVDALEDIQGLSYVDMARSLRVQTTGPCLRTCPDHPQYVEEDEDDDG